MKSLQREQKIFLFAFFIYTVVCIIIYFSFILLNHLIVPCPQAGSILSFQDNETLSVRLWSFISIWSISSMIPEWQPYAPMKAMELFSNIFDTNGNLKNFNELSLVCQKKGELYKPGKFKVLNMANYPQEYADLALMLKGKIIEEFLFSKNVAYDVSSFIEREIQALLLEEELVRNLILLIISEETKHDKNVMNFYSQQIQELMKNNPLIIVLGDRSLLTGLNETTKYRLIEPFDFSISEELYLASQCNDLIIDSSDLSTFYTLFSKQRVHIYNPKEPIKTVTKNLKNWHHYGGNIS